MIVLNKQLLDDIDKPGGVQRALQKAIELEHATLPPYLYAYYSLGADNYAAGTANLGIANLILSVIQEEMLHFAIACNILNAIGGSPCIDKSDFIPDYPGPLPGGVESNLVVHLKRFSLQQDLDTFMTIEEPEDPLHFRALAMTETQVTIGQYYAKIKDKIAELGQGIFTGDPSRQVLGGGFPSSELFPIRSVADAGKGIEIIQQQGEGTTTSPLDPDGIPRSENQFAHYYRFAEIYHGHELQAVPNPPPGTPPDQLYRYDGAPIPFDESKVLPVIDNPSASKYPPNTQAHYLNNNFNYAYTSLLKSLHHAFNGHPDYLKAAIRLMHSLRELALEMMTSTRLPNGENPGPSFEYQPINPGGTAG
jgi:Ferritin-like